MIITAASDPLELSPVVVVEVVSDIGQYIRIQNTVVDDED